MSDRATEPQDLELAQRRIMFAMLRPAAVLAAAIDFPLKELTSFVRLSYFRELREAGATLAEAAQTMEVSSRTAKRLGSQLRSDFFVPEVEHNVARRIEFMTWAEPLSLARIRQLLSTVAAEEVEHALAKLRAEDRVERIEGDRTVRYKASRLVSRLVDDAFSNRIGALNSLLQNVAETVKRRFIDDDGLAFARTLNFRVNPDDVAELRVAYDALLARMLELEAQVDEPQSAVPIRLSVLWAEIEGEALKA